MKSRLTGTVNGASGTLTSHVSVPFVAPTDDDDGAMPTVAVAPASSCEGYIVGLWNSGVNDWSITGACIVSRAVPSLTIRTVPVTCEPRHAVPRSSAAGVTCGFGVTNLSVTGSVKSSASTVTLRYVPSMVVSTEV